MRLRQRGGETMDGNVQTEETLEFDWPQVDEPTVPPPGPPPEPPRRRPRLRLRLSRAPIHRRRRRLAVFFVSAPLVGVAIALVILLAAGSGPSARERAQLAAAGPGTLGHGAAATAIQRTMAAMPLPRRVAQLFVMGTTARGPGDPFFSSLRSTGWGGVMLSPLDPGTAGHLNPRFGAAARQAGGVTPLVVATQPGGQGSIFSGLPPRSAPAVGKSGDPAVAAKEATAAAKALQRLHVSMTLAPDADVGSITGPDQDVSYGDAPRLVARMTAAAVRAYNRAGIISAVGHFPGEGAASDDPDTTTATVGLSLNGLRGRDLRPFRAVAKTAPVVVMSNAVYAAYDGVTPAVLLPEVVGGLLRHELGFKGVVMTDDLGSTAPVLGQSVGASAVQALEAGADLLYVADPAQQQQAYRAVLAAVRRGTISRQRLRISLERVLALKRRHGLLPAPPPARSAQPALAFQAAHAPTRGR